MLLSQHIVQIVQDQVNYKANKINEILKSSKLVDDKPLVSKYVKEFISETMEHLLSLLNKEDRQEFFNDMGRQFNMKVEDEKKQPLYIETVRDNFNQIVAALKLYDVK